MTFPYHDRAWTEVADFLLAHRRDGETVLAPDVFHYVVEHIYRDIDTRLHPGREYDWLVVDPADVTRFSPDFLRVDVARTMRPVFANPRLVLFARRTNDRVRAISGSDPAMLAYYAAVHAADATSVNAVDLAAEPVLPDHGQIFEFDRLGNDELGPAMDDFYRHGGYEANTLRDRVLKAQMLEAVRRFVGDGGGQRILDLCCGVGKLGDVLTTASEVVGVDISPVAVEQARAAHADRPEFSFEPMNAEFLTFPDASFDTVLFVDSIEHLLHPRVALAEARRVLRPGGHLLVTSANSESLHLVMIRKLGHPDFRTSFQHVHEYTVAELTGLLDEVGFERLDALGVFLYPYWGIPGVDGVVRHLTDHDPDIVEVMRLLGSRVGPEHSYEFAIWARKVA